RFAGGPDRAHDPQDQRPERAPQGAPARPPQPPWPAAARRPPPPPARLPAEHRHHQVPHADRAPRPAPLARSAPGGRSRGSPPGKVAIRADTGPGDPGPVLLALAWVITEYERKDTSRSPRPERLGRSSVVVPGAFPPRGLRSKTGRPYPLVRKRVSQSRPRHGGGWVRDLPQGGLTREG